MLDKGKASKHVHILQENVWDSLGGKGWEEGVLQSLQTWPSLFFRKNVFFPANGVCNMFTLKNFSDLKG